MGSLNFNADTAPEREQRDHDVLPKGTKVAVQVSEAGWKDNKNGGRRVAITLDSIDEAHPGRKFWDAFNLDMGSRDDDKAKKAIVIAEAALGELCRASDRRAIDEPEELIGAVCTVKLGVQPEKGGYPARNTIAEYLRPDGSEAGKGGASTSTKVDEPKAAPRKPWAR